MKAVFTVLSLIFCLLVFAQKKETFYDYAWKPTDDFGRARFLAVVEKKDSLWLRTDYFIKEKKIQMLGAFRDEETNIEQGPFEYYHANGNLQSKGAYTHGKKNGLWLSFYDNGMMFDSVVYDNGNIIGTSQGWHRNGFPRDSSIYRPDGSGVSVNWYDNGVPSDAGVYTTGRKKQGKWQYFHRNGQLSSLEIYEADKLLSKQYFDEQGMEVSDTTPKDREASFPGGIKAWTKYLEKNLYFPSQYKINGSDQIVVTVDWTVDEEGKVGDVFVSSPFHPAFDKIAAEVIQKSPKWLPAISHNRKVKAYRRQPVTFAQL